MADDTTTTTTTDTTTTTPWTTGIDAELLGHAQNRGWDKLTPDKAAVEAMKAHREAEKFLGVPKDRLLTLPANQTDPEAMAPVWERLGAPKEVKGYDFSGAKFKDGTAPDQAFVDKIGAAALAAHLPKDAATTVVKAVVEYLDADKSAKAADKSAALVMEKENLKTNWGTNSERFMVVAKAGAAKLGVTPEDVAALESVVGYARVMDMFRKVGTATGEDPFHGAELGSDANKGLTKEQAIAKKVELEHDTEWAKRYLAGGVAENREMTSLIKIIVGAS